MIHSVSVFFLLQAFFLPPTSFLIADSEGNINAKRQRKETPPPEFVTKPLNKSMISLLVKLYAKLSNKEVAYLSPDLREVDSAPREVGVAYFVWSIIFYVPAY